MKISPNPSLPKRGTSPLEKRGMEGDLMRIVLNNNINNDLDVYFQRKLTEKCSSRYASFLNDNNIKSLLSVFF